MLIQNLPLHVPINPQKFKNTEITADGKKRASVPLDDLETLWFNTGSLCNITCKDCFMESSPKNDLLAYLTLEEVQQYLREAKHNNLSITQVAFTGGEPFMNPQIIDMINEGLSQRLSTLVLSNGMKPLLNNRCNLLNIKKDLKKLLHIRISIDHYNCFKHEQVRGPNTWQPMIKGLKWLSDEKFNVSIAGRNRWGETEAQTRSGYAHLFKKEGLTLDHLDPSQLILFPEMNEKFDVPEITESCFEILGKKPNELMCSKSRMVVKRKGSASPSVVPCTLLPYDIAFDMGQKLITAMGKVYLNHPHCAKFCVLGGASCTSK